MAFTATLEMDKDIAKISLVGELDASSATLFKTEIEKAAVHHPTANEKRCSYVDG